MVKIFVPLGLLFLTLVIALAVKFYYAFSTEESVMTGDYFEVGRDYDAYVRNQNTGNRILRADFIDRPGTLHSGSNNLELTISSPDKKPVSGAAVLVQLTRKATVRGIISARCTTDTAGRCPFSVNIPGTGDWDLEIISSDAGGKLKFLQRINIRG